MTTQGIALCVTAHGGPWAQGTVTRDFHPCVPRAGEQGSKRAGSTALGSTQTPLRWGQHPLPRHGWALRPSVTALRPSGIVLRPSGTALRPSGTAGTEPQEGRHSRSPLSPPRKALGSRSLDAAAFTTAREPRCRCRCRYRCRCRCRSLPGPSAAPPPQPRRARTYPRPRSRGGGGGGGAGKGWEGPGRAGRDRGGTGGGAGPAPEAVPGWRCRSEPLRCAAHRGSEVRSAPCSAPYGLARGEKLIKRLQKRCFDAF